GRGESDDFAEGEWAGVRYAEARLGRVRGFCRASRLVGRRIVSPRKFGCPGRIARSGRVLGCGAYQIGRRLGRGGARVCHYSVIPRVFEFWNLQPYSLKEK